MVEQNKMETSPVLRLIISMSLPPLFSMFLQYTYNFVDCIFVSWISEDALTAVSLSFPLTTFMLATSIGIGVGINILIAKKLGEKDYDEANLIVNHGIILSTVMGLTIMTLVFIILKPYFESFGLNPRVYALSIEYMKVCTLMQVPNMVHIAIQKIIQATVNMLAPMGFQIAGVVLNFVLDPILIFGYGPFPEMGIKGAAISTVLGYSLSMVLAFYVLIFRRQKVKIKIAGFRIDFGIFKNIFILGMPSFVMNVLGAVMVSVTNIFLINYSTTAVAFFGAYFKAQQLIVMTVNGLIQGTIPIMSYNFGAKNTKRLNVTARYASIIAGAMMGFGSVLLMVFPESVLRIFMASEEMMVFGVPALRIMSLSYVFNGLSTIIASYMQATARVRYSILINLMRQLLVLVPSMWILSKFIGILGIWMSFILAEIICFIYAYRVYKKKKLTI